MGNGFIPALYDTCLNFYDDVRIFECGTTFEHAWETNSAILIWLGGCCWYVLDEGKCQNVGNITTLPNCDSSTMAHLVEYFFGLAWNSREYSYSTLTFVQMTQVVHNNTRMVPILRYMSHDKGLRPFPHVASHEM